MALLPHDTTSHSGVRPLSPHGEGYCRWCFFVVGLTDRGLLEAHTRGIVSYGAAKTCPGTDTRPPKNTPYASRKAAFKQTAPKAWCPVCKRFVPTKRQAGTYLYAVHNFRPGISAALCPSSKCGVTQQDQANARG